MDVTVGVGVGKGQVPISVMFPVPNVITTLPDLAQMFSLLKNNVVALDEPSQLVQLKVFPKQQGLETL